MDIYSFGVILWELVTGDSPQRGRMRAIKCVAFVHAYFMFHVSVAACCTAMQTLLHVTGPHVMLQPLVDARSRSVCMFSCFPMCYRVPEECPPGVADLVNACMERDASIRPSAAEIVQLLSGDPAALERRRAAHASTDSVFGNAAEVGHMLLPTARLGVICALCKHVRARCKGASVCSVQQHSVMPLLTRFAIAYAGGGVG